MQMIKNKQFWQWHDFSYLLMRYLYFVVKNLSQSIYVTSKVMSIKGHVNRLKFGILGSAK